MARVPAHNVLFIHGAGEGAFEEDEPLAKSLREALGSEFEVVYPRMPETFDATYEDWTDLIARALTGLEGPVTFVGHSVGGSVLLKYLAESPLPVATGAHILAAPFWGADDFWAWEPARLPADASDKLAYLPGIFLYHSRDDEVVPFTHLELYRALLPEARYRVLDGRGHQFGHDLSEVAGDVRA